MNKQNSAPAENKSNQVEDKNYEDAHEQRSFVDTTTIASRDDDEDSDFDELSNKK